MVGQIAGQEEIKSGLFQHRPELEDDDHLVRVEVVTKLSQRRVQVLPRDSAEFEIGHRLFREAPQDVDPDAFLLQIGTMKNLRNLAHPQRTSATGGQPGLYTPIPPELPLSRDLSSHHGSTME